MSVTYYPQRTVVPLDLPDADTHRRDLARATNLLLAGHNNATIGLTLDGATTVLTDPRVSLQTCLQLMPTSAAAAAALPSLWIVCEKGQATINGGSAGLTYTAALTG